MHGLVSWRDFKRPIPIPIGASSHAGLQHGDRTGAQLYLESQVRGRFSLLGGGGGRGGGWGVHVGLFGGTLHMGDVV